MGIATGAMINGLCKTAQTPRRHSCSHHRPKPRGTAQQGTQGRLSAVALIQLVPPVAAADAIATVAMILVVCKTAQIPRRRSCSHHRPKPRGTAQQGMQVRLSAVALTPLGPLVAAADAIATGAMINGLCKTSQIPRRRSCSRCRPKPRGTAQQDMQVRLSVVALTPSGPRVAAANVTATLAKILAFPEQRLLAKEWHFTVVARE